MERIAAVFLAVAVAVAGPAMAADRHRTSAGPVVVERMIDDLDEPWAIAFLPGGQVLVTEREGDLLLFDGGKRHRVRGVPDVYARGQGGLLDVVAARDFARTGEIFLTYARPGAGGARTALAVARLDLGARRLTDLRVIFEMSAASGGGRHFGSRVAEAPDGTLFLTIGDRGQDAAAQNLGVHNGKVVRVNRDGSVPGDNPFAATGGARPEIWSLGHRNPQAAAFDAEGRYWAVEHGAQGGDEVNTPERGRNYGWPVISYGKDYDGSKIGTGTTAAGMEQPRHYWDPSIAPSGMMIYSGRLFPAWRGDIFVGSLKFHYIARLDRSGARVGAEEALFRDAYYRIRDIREAPDGSIWFLSVGDGAAYRITPG